MCLGLEAIEKLRSVNFFLVELEIVLGRQDLHLVGLLMRAHLVRLEKVYGVDLLVNVEVPRAEYVVLEAVDWLIGLDNIIDAEIVQQACDCERCLK